MFSHVSEVPGGTTQRMINLGRDSCSALAKGSSILVDGDVIPGAAINSSRVVTLISAGKLMSDGSCEGTEVNIRGVYMKNMVVTRSYNVITYQETLTLEGTQLQVSPGTLCAWDLGHCFDVLTGNHVWDVMGENSTKTFDQWGYITTLVGQISNISSLDGHDSLTIFHGRIDGRMAALQLTTVPPMDHISIYGVGVKDVFAIPLNNQVKESLFSSRSSANPQTQIQLAYQTLVTTARYESYVNLAGLLASFKTDHCYQRRKEKLRLVETARVEGRPVLWEVGDSSIRYATTAGDAVRIITCPVVQAEVAVRNSCYTDLPVMYMGSDYYIQPLTRMMVSTSRNVTCNALTAPVWKIGQYWLSLTPQIILRSEVPEWKEADDNDHAAGEPVGMFAKIGLYNEDEISGFYSFHESGRSPIASQEISGGKLNSYLALDNPQTWHWVLVASLAIGGLIAAVAGLWCLGCCAKTAASCLHSFRKCGQEAEAMADSTDLTTKPAGAHEASTYTFPPARNTV
jgi:hypothetical protein